MHETRLTPRNPDFADNARRIFNEAPFIKDVGYELDFLEPGRCQSVLTLQPKHKQQNNYVHAGVIATMADHTAGASGGSLIAADEIVLTIEYKINLLRPGVGESLRCLAEVLRNGRTVIVSDAYVYARQKSREKLVGRATVTLAVLKGQRPI